MGLGSNPGPILNQLSASGNTLKPSGVQSVPMKNEAKIPWTIVEGVERICEKLGLERKGENQET